MNIAEIAEAERKKKLAAIERTPLNTLMEGERCCLRAFTKLGRGGLLDKMASFTCEKCGQEYRMTETASGTRKWIAHVFVEFLR